MPAIKLIANTVAVTATHAEITDGRFQRIYNSNTTVIANVSFGTTSSAVSTMITVGPGHVVLIDIGELRSGAAGDGEVYVSLNAACDHVFRTPVSNG
jgi:hypothetical protein